MRASTTSTASEILPGPKIIGFPHQPSIQIEVAATPSKVTADPDLRPETPRAQPREFAYRFAATLMAGDAIFAFAAIFLGLTIRETQRIGWRAMLDHPPSLASELLIWSGVGTLLFIWLMMILRTYDANNLYRMQRTFKNLVRATLLWAVAIWAGVGLFRIEGFSPRIGTAYCIVTLGSLVGLWRLAALAILLQPRVKELVSSRIIVVGWNEKATNLRRAMRMDLAQLGEIIGCVPMPGGRFATRPPSDLAILGDYSALPDLIRECQTNSIILADVSCSSDEIHHLISFCQRELISFKLVPQYFPALNSGLQVQTLSGVPLLGVSQLPLDRSLNRVIKRGLDLIGATVGLALSALVVPIFCAIVYIESPGPVIFKQRRTSRSGRSFFIYKIRSMRLNAESGTGAVWCKQQDPRRLKIGTFMRKTNIDELPQFWNVLIGDMSLVGPRPERPELIAKFKDEIPNYNARHEVRAGLTGWAQIKGLRGDTDLKKRIEADLYYLENWNVLLDLYCIAATFFKTKGAH